jgi:hypothetical protein
MPNEVAQTLKQEIDKLIEYLDTEIEKLSLQNDDETIALETALLTDENVPRKEVMARFLSAIRQLQNHDLMCCVQGQLEKARKTIEKINR